MTSPSRATVDFEAFARDLQQPHLPGADSAAPSQAPAAAKGDPLAELARIIGQDDPFRALLEARDGRRGAASQARIEPSFAEHPVADPLEHALHQPAARPAYRAPEPAPARHDTPADAFDQYLASVDRDYHEDAAYQAQAQAQAEGESVGEEAYEGRALKRVAPRRKLVSVGAGIAVVVLSVTGALTWRGMHHGGTAGGGVPVIKADTAPLKIQPKTADGVEIPDQNKQIYEPKAKDGQIRIVNREEQPLDVASAARAAQGPESSASTTPGGTQGGLSDAFGEPRRVRTVSVKPDTPVPAQAQAQAQAPSQAKAYAQQAETQTPPAALIPTMMLPDSGPPAAQAPRARPVRQAVALPPSVPAPTVPAPAAEATRVVAPPAPTRVKAPQRVASVAPDAVSPIEAPATTSATTSAATPSSTASVGGFSVQLGVRNSAGDAQAAFKQMQAKYAELAGQPALIRQAEVNGKTLFRVRVGPLAKDEATSLCSKLQGEGGQCFVAKN